MIISYADKKREWVEIGFAWFFWRFQGVKSYSNRTKNGFCGSKKGRRREPPPETKRNKKHSEERKGEKTQNMPTSEELRGDSPSGLAANAPFRSALSLSFYPSLSELFGGCLTAPQSGALV